MYVFAVAALLGLAVMAVAMIAERYLSLVQEFWALVVVALGIGVAWLADFNLFGLWAIGVRYEWVGILLTGVALAGIAHVWHGFLGLFTGLIRKYNDEAETIEKSQGLRRVA
ncbi:MAG TPA: hypothetical protein VFA46_16325 [Actinomycetes bacterium]|jgi:hypothetical protein|nr:hypothetical protein [Actinomycetes bacterium]